MPPAILPIHYRILGHGLTLTLQMAKSFIKLMVIQGIPADPRANDVSMTTRYMTTLMAPIHCRIVGNALTVALQCFNGAMMMSVLRGDVMKDPDISTMASMMMRFITVWNVCILTAYSVMALTFDVLTMLNKDYLLPKSANKFRDFIFSSLVWPMSLLVFTLFWPFYIYDRNLIYPEFIDKVFYQASSYVIHMTIVPSVIWELTYQHRETGSHKAHISFGLLFYFAYNIVLYYTYYARGVWPYNLMGIVYNNTYYHIIFHIYIFVVLMIVYYLQWPIKYYLWSENVTKKKVY